MVEKNDAYLMYENRNFQTTLINGRKNDAYYRSRGVQKLDLHMLKIKRNKDGYLMCWTIRVPKNDAHTW